MAKLRFEWSPNPAGEQVTGYSLQINKNGVAFKTVPVTSPFHEETITTPGLYSGKVLANNVAGSSAFCAEVNGPGVPSVPTDLVITTVP